MKTIINNLEDLLKATGCEDLNEMKEMVNWNSDCGALFSYDDDGVTLTTEDDEDGDLISIRLDYPFFNTDFSTARMELDEKHEQVIDALYSEDDSSYNYTELDNEIDDLFDYA